MVSTIHKPALRALSYARGFRPDHLEALTVSVDREEAAALRERWEDYGIEVPLKILDSPYREVGRPVVDCVRSVHRESPRDVVAVFIPEYVVGHWWENLLRNQSVLWLKSRLLFTSGVTSVPRRLTSSACADRPGVRAPRLRPPRRTAEHGGAAGGTYGIPAGSVTGIVGPRLGLPCPTRCRPEADVESGRSPGRCGALSRLGKRTHSVSAAVRCVSAEVAAYVSRQ